MRRLSRAALAVLVALGAALVSWVPARAAGASPIFSNPLVTVGGTGPIQHVIVIIQSGHSFDNYFGTRTGVDPIPPKTCLPIVVGSRVCVRSYPLNPDEARAGLISTLGVTRKAIDNGKMDRFVSAQPNAAIGTLAMGYLNGGDLPYYWNLASRFTLLDHFFATSQAGALPNRLAAVSGTDGGLVSNTVPAAGINLPTVFDQLAQKHLSWKYYVQNYAASGNSAPPSVITRTPVLAMQSVTGSAQAHRIVDTSQYFHDIDVSQLPAVSYISSSRADSEQSPQGSAQGEAFVSSVLNALMQSPTWYHTAVLLTYDNSGGWYDHVAPPVVAGKQLGIRVPTMLISPYARAGYVDHNQFQTASIPDFIDKVFGMPALNADAAGTNLLGALNLKQAPIAPTIERRSVATLVRPSVLGIYVLYLGALLAAGLLLTLAFLRMRRIASASDASVLTSAAPPTGEGERGSSRSDSEDDGEADALLSPDRASPRGSPEPPVPEPTGQGLGSEPPAGGDPDAGGEDEQVGTPIEVSAASDFANPPTAPDHDRSKPRWRRLPKWARSAAAGDLPA